MHNLLQECDILPGWFIRKIGFRADYEVGRGEVGERRYNLERVERRVQGDLEFSVRPNHYLTSQTKRMMNQNSPQFIQSISSNCIFPIVPQTDHGPIALPHPPLPQAPCQKITPLIELPVCQSLPLRPRNDRRAVTVSRDNGCEVLWDGLCEERRLEGSN
jgi:hypothetical protein